MVNTVTGISDIPTETVKSESIESAVNGIVKTESVCIPINRKYIYKRAIPGDGLLGRSMTTISYIRWFHTYSAPIFC